MNPHHKFPFTWVAFALALLLASPLHAQEGSASNEPTISLGLDGSGGISSGVEYNLYYSFRPWVGWRQGAHTTIGLYGHLQHRASHDLSYKEYGLGAFGTYELWPGKKISPYARLGAGIHYATWRVEDQRTAGLVPQVSPELGLRWQVSQRLSLNMGYRYSLNLPLGNRPAYRGGQFLLGVRWKF